MPERIQFPEWPDANATTNYPFSAVATMTNGKRTLAQGVFLDAALWPVGAVGALYLSRVVVGQTSITVYVGDDATPELAHGTFDFPVTQSALQLVDAYGRPAGTLASDANRLAVLAGWGTGDYSFAADQTEFVASTCFPQPASAVRGVLLDDGTLLDGEVWLVGDDGVALRHEQVTRPDGVTQDVIRVDVVGDPLFRRRLCFPLDLFATPRFLRELVITDGRQYLSLSPDAAGGVKMTANNDLAQDTVLRIRSAGTEIVIEAVGNTGAFIPLTDTTYTPPPTTPPDPTVYDSLSVSDPSGPLPPLTSYGGGALSRLGVNHEQNVYYGSTHEFRNCVLSAQWPYGSAANPAGAGGGPAVDEQKQPLGDFGLLLWSAQVHMGGDYHFSFRGKATIGKTSFTLVSQTYNALTNVTSGVLRFPESSLPMNGYIGFTNTVRLDGSTDKGITNLKILRPGYTTDEGYFTDEFLDLQDPYGIHRFMDKMTTNNNLGTDWGTRTSLFDMTWGPVSAKQTVTKPTYSFTRTVFYNTTWPYEIMVEFMIRTGKDIWICIPAHADDNYTTQLSNYLKIHVPVGQHVYFEYGNENWNTQFEQHDYNVAMATTQAGVDSVLANNSTVKNGEHYGWCRTAEQCLKFKIKCGLSDDRFRAVYATQVGYKPFGYQAKVAFKFIQAKYGTPSNYFYAVAIAPYFGGANPQEVFVYNPALAHWEYDPTQPGVYPPKYGVTTWNGKTVTSTYPTGSVFVNGTFTKRWDRDDLTPDMVANAILENAESNTSTSDRFQGFKAFGIANNVKIVCYEGGVDIGQSGHSYQAKVDGQLRSNTGQALLASVGNVLSTDTVDFYCYFQLCTANSVHGYWGLTTRVGDLTQIKYTTAKTIAEANTF